MQIEYIEPIRRAWNRMVEVLYRNFDFAKYLAIAFCAWLAMLAVGGGGGGTLYQHGPGDDLSELPGSAKEGLESIFQGLLLISVVVLILLLVVSLLILLLWLSSRGKFMFLDNVLQNRGEVVIPWKKFRRLGNSLFFLADSFWFIVHGAAFVDWLANRSPVLSHGKRPVPAPCNPARPSGRHCYRLLHCSSLRLVFSREFHYPYHARI